jgi:hypothetical protein
MNNQAIVSSLTLSFGADFEVINKSYILDKQHVIALELEYANESSMYRFVALKMTCGVPCMMQVLSNAVYKSVEHRVTVSAAEDRLSMAFFYNPRSDLPIAPMADLVTADRPALYPEMTLDEYRVYIRKRGLAGKAQLESLQSPRSKPPTGSRPGTAADHTSSSS